MTTVTPIQQPPLQSLRKALEIAQGWGDSYTRTHGATRGETINFLEIARLIREALDKLGEPNAAMLAMLEAIMDVLPPASIRQQPDDYARYIRDTAALLLNAQVRGTI